MPVRLKIVATGLFLTEVVDGHKDGLIFDKRLDNLHLWGDPPKEKSALSIYDTHPRPVLRLLSLLHHGELSAEPYLDRGIARIFEKVANDIGFRFKPFNLISIDEIIEASKRIEHEDNSSTDELEFFQAIDAATDSFWNDYPEFLQRIMVRAFGKFVTSTAVTIGSELVKRVPTAWMDRFEFDGECQSIKLWSALSKRLYLKWGDEDKLEIALTKLGTMIAGSEEMKSLSSEKKAQLKIELSKRPELVESFLKRSGDADNFTEIPWLEIATAVAAALTMWTKILKPSPRYSSSSRRLRSGLTVKSMARNCHSVNGSSLSRRVALTPPREVAPSRR
jgi:hypothetical protein